MKLSEKIAQKIEEIASQSTSRQIEIQEAQESNNKIITPKTVGAAGLGTVAGAGGTYYAGLDSNGNWDANNIQKNAESAYDNLLLMAARKSAQENPVGVLKETVPLYAKDKAYEVVQNVKEQLPEMPQMPQMPQVQAPEFQMPHIPSIDDIARPYAEKAAELYPKQSISGAVSDYVGDISDKIHGMFN